MKKKLMYLGLKDNEEFYINLDDGELTGWSLMGLRPETEDNLRATAREIDPSDLGYEIPEFMLNYFDWDSWYDDMEDDWYERHDVQATYDKEGETYYLGFGTGTDIFNFFKEHKIKTFDDFCNVFDDVNLNEKQFNEFIKIMNLYKKDEKKGYSAFMKFQENISEFPKGCENE